MNETGSSESRIAEGRPAADVRRLQLVPGLLEQGLPVRMRVHGLSMKPFLRDDDVVTITPLGGREPAVGQIVAFVLPADGTLLIHRLVSREQAGWVVRGDNRRESDGVVPLVSIVGIVTGIERDGRPMSLGPDFVAAGVAWSSRNGLLRVLSTLSRRSRRAASALLSRLQGLSFYRRVGRRLVRGIEVEQSSPVEVETFKRRNCTAAGSTLLTVRAHGLPVGTWVARRRGRAIGFAELVELAAPGSPEEGLWLSALVVRVPYRGRGVGKALASQVLDRARSLSPFGVRLAVLEGDRPAIRLFRTLGFTPDASDALAPLLSAENELMGGRRSLMRATAGQWDEEPSLSPEIRTLLACAQATLFPQRDLAFRRALAACAVADRLCEAARVQGMLGHLHRLVSGSGTELAGRLEELQRVAVQRDLRQTAHLLRVLATLHEKGIDVLAYKGPVSSLQLYGDITLRTWEDLDLAVRHEQARALRDVLLSHGFVDANRHNERVLARKTRGWGEITLHSEQSGLYLDVHWNVAVAFSGGWLPAEELLDHAVAVEILGREVLGPSVVDALLISTVNGTKDRWNNVEGLLGLGVQVQRLPADWWPQVLSRARDARCYRRTIVGIGHACRVLGLECPPEVARVINRDARIRALLDRLSATTLDKGSTLDSRGQLARLSWRFSTEDSTVAALRHFAARLFVPGHEDWDIYQAPGWLSWTYVVVRPLRLAGKWARRL